jgi:cytidine deaminase
VTLNNEEFIEKARKMVKPVKQRHGMTIGDCATILETNKGNLYSGVSIDTPSGMGFCSEHAAVAAMVSGGEYKIKRIVAVLEDGTVLPPCGRCREFIYQIDKDNLETKVIISKDKSVKLKELLPYPWDENL